MAKHFQVDPGNTLTTGLVSYYNMQTDGTDYWATNNLAITGSPTFSSSYGKVNNGVFLNGATQYLSTSTPTGLPTGNHDTSISGWVYFTVNQPSGIPALLSFGTQNTAQMAGFGFGAPGTDGLYWLSYSNDANTTWSYSLSTWYMVTATYTASTQTVQFYVNGTAQGTGIVLASTPNVGSTFLDISAQRPSNIVGLTAYVDEVGLWSKVLSSTEITDLYNSGNGQTMVSDTLTTLTKNTQYAVKTTPAAKTEPLKYRLTTLDFSRQAQSTLPSTASDLSTTYSGAETSEVYNDSGTYVTIGGATASYAVHQFKSDLQDNTHPIVVKWIGQSSVAASLSAMYLQIFNNNSGAWETLASNTTSAANTDVTLEGVQSSNLSYYYGTNNQVAVRVYQQEAH